MLLYHGPTDHESQVVASFTKGVNPRLAKRPLKTNGRLANRGLTSLVKKDHRRSCEFLKYISPDTPGRDVTLNLFYDIDICSEIPSVIVLGSQILPT